MGSNPSRPNNVYGFDESSVEESRLMMEAAANARLRGFLVKLENERRRKIDEFNTQNRCGLNPHCAIVCVV